MSRHAEKFAPLPHLQSSDESLVAPEAMIGEDPRRITMHTRGDGDGGEGDSFLRAFVRAGGGVAESVMAAAKSGSPSDGLLSYAGLISETWSVLKVRPSEAEVTPASIGAAWFTLDSFLEVCAATTPFTRQAKERCIAALHWVSSYLGAEGSHLENRVDAELRALDMSEGRFPLEGEPGLKRAWQYLAELPIAPAGLPDRSADVGEATGAFRGAEPAMPAHVEEVDPEAEATHLYDVWFGTNRQPVDAADPAKGFTNERAADGTVHYGTCAVEIPRTHKFGSLGTPFWKRWIRLQFTDDHLKLRKISSFPAEQDFLTALREEMEALGEGERVVLVYLHGYNTSFDEAARRAAQIGFDLKVPGAMAFYSWPSKAEVRGYPADIARVEASEKQIADFLTALVSSTGATQVHVIAHSMGNRGFARAVARITAHASAVGNVKFGQILLAAPDIDVDLFNELARVYPSISKRTTMYVSAKDRALGMSSWLQDSNRAGFTPPVTLLDGIDTIEVTNIDLTLLGHGYFAEAAPVLYDIKELMDSNSDPDKRLRTRPMGPQEKRYWVIGA
jgi:esterase/lipase superfamily enzyme